METCMLTTGYRESCKVIAILLFLSMPSCHQKHMKILLKGKGLN
jgi:hypothetical protein